ncbi:hypothetical protein ONZ45_g18188 [Pleurotus djamor]|nr:hypothetical protein ONZ45_g18188 [Pleurotus djamor]
MDAISKLEDTETQKVLIPTLIAFTALLEERRTVIESVPKRTHTYGSTPRHKLDIYYPPSATNSKLPILIYVYGGGFTSGERVLPPPFDLVYANVGSFYASRGFITVIADHRLVPDVKSPGQPEDIRDAFEWIVSNLERVSADENLPKADMNSIFLSGHSSGAAHAAFLLLYPGFMATELKERVKGITLITGTYHNFPAGMEGGFADLVGSYWADEEDVRKTDTLTLINALSDEESSKFPPILLVEGTREPVWLVIVGKDFYEAVTRKRGLRVEKVVADGHNHVSSLACLSSGQGEEWAEKSAEWMTKILG